MHPINAAEGVTRGPEDTDPPHLPRLLCLGGEKAESKPCDGDRHAYDLHLHLRLGQPERPRTYRATCEASSRDARRGRHEKRPWGPRAVASTTPGPGQAPRRPAPADQTPPAPPWRTPQPPSPPPRAPRR